jgi:tetratricopeptide (TPR) repeat protein
LLRFIIAVCAVAIGGWPGASLARGPGLGAAEQARARGDEEGELRLLSEAIERDPTLAGAHARLAEITGQASRAPISSADASVLRGLQHPYDPWALLRAGDVLARGGRLEEAVVFLEKAVWLADVDPASGLAALHRLREIDARWQARRIVPVHVYADAAFRSAPGWRFRLRTLWLAASNTLGDVLATRFVPIWIADFDSESRPYDLDSGSSANDLDAIARSFAAQTSPPEEGIIAAVTGRAAPAGPGHRKGVAVFLGRRLTVRVDPHASKSRVLAHELLHLYGAIHVAEEVDSLMNPMGTSLALDTPSLAIVRAIRDRDFGNGGIERNVMPHIALDAAIAAYMNALGVNLGYREARIAAVLQARQTDAPDAGATARHATAMDPHLADAAGLLAVLLLADARDGDAASLLDLAAKLYGDSPRAAELSAQALTLRARLEASGAIED